MKNWLRRLCMCTINWNGWGKKLSYPTSKYCSLISLEGLQKSMMSPSQDSLVMTWTHYIWDALAMSLPALWIIFPISFSYSSCNQHTWIIHHCLPCTHSDTYVSYPKCELLIPLDNILNPIFSGEPFLLFPHIVECWSGRQLLLHMCHSPVARQQWTLQEELLQHNSYTSLKSMTGRNLRPVKGGMFQWHEVIGFLHGKECHYARNYHQISRKNSLFRNMIHIRKANN
jgi:hypothetical protein